MRSDTRQELLQAELDSQEAFISLAKQSRHDLRYHNALLMEYVEEGEVKGQRNI